MADASTNRMLPGWQRWINLDRTSFHKPDGTRLAAMHEARSEMLPPNRMLPGWQRWIKLDRTSFHKPDVTRLAAMHEARSEMLPPNRMLPGWQRWVKLDRTSFHKPDVTRLAAMHEARWQMLPQTHVTMLAATDQTRSHKLPQTGYTRLAAMHEARWQMLPPNRMLPGWQRWIKLDRTSFHEPDVTRLAAMHEARWQMLPQTGCYQVGSDGLTSIAQASSTNKMLPGWQQCMLLESDAPRNRTSPRLAAMHVSSVLATAACPSRQEAQELARAGDATWLRIDLGLSGCDPPRSSSKLPKPANKRVRQSRRWPILPPAIHPPAPNKAQITCN